MTEDDSAGKAEKDDEAAVTQWISWLIEEDENCGEE